MTPFKDSIAKFIYDNLTKMAFEAVLQMRTTVTADLTQSPLENVGIGPPQILTTTTPTIDVSSIVRDMFKLLIRQTTNLK